ncbi:hypothetical protein DV515_00015158 [Chloebia gouldiae]|uniref:Uncharacterized protein n=1 Tax=Chloebia gouldiae TaxID=44316 RepID=A0A3L8RXK0_CHLGU|nr:hypothetical protein DV515_00015158 [Chloebia gouldiae]
MQATTFLEVFWLSPHCDLTSCCQSSDTGKSQCDVISSAHLCNFCTSGCDSKEARGQGQALEEHLPGCCQAQAAQ